MSVERQPRRLRGLQVALVAVFALALACGCARSTTPKEGPPPLASAPSIDASASIKEAIVDAGPPKPAQIDEDGDDDPEDPGEGAAPALMTLEKVGAPPMALTRICDLTPFGDALYAAHANQPLGTDGATITKYRPDPPPGKPPFAVAFDWNRPGEPAKGGGAGQGFLRVHAIGGRLFAADADPPYNGLGLVEYGTEGYVFVSDRAGVFAPPRAPHYRPPVAPDLLSWNEGRAGAAVLPRAYHVIDAIRYRGALYASTGSVPPKERAWNGPSPGALHRASDDGTRWTYEVDYPFPWQNGVWRLTFMVRFRDRLYAGIQDYDGREPNDFLYFAPSGEALPSKEEREAGAPPPPMLAREDIHPVRVTRAGAAGTLRWWVDRKASPPRLYWLAWGRDGVILRITTDGDRWAAVALPDDAGRPTDVTRFRDAVVVLTERGLYKLSGPSIDGDAEPPNDGVATVTATPIARIEDKKSPFAVSDFFCVAPLAVFKNALYAGGQRGGTLYRFTE
ncbi:MAG: hypothetical protein KF819_02255 [Labilithrix sp.]|nr:hypothetical protein [Labilithrix sp.]